MITDLTTNPPTITTDIVTRAQASYTDIMNTIKTYNDKIKEIEEHLAETDAKDLRLAIAYKIADIKKLVYSIKTIKMM